ncbi:hypothetical protein [Halorientalis marina]|jgi:hypothetical protein|uniref:hypothetical protein n=1 Tax=Halorientalis marina TaxID=2931976 RepID=UPI001FF6CA28|nr:hypothetical protein [Halorientalis marina]
MAPESTDPGTGHDDDDTATQTPTGRLRSWLTARPARGAALLALGSLLLSWQALLFVRVPDTTITSAGYAGIFAPLLGVVLAGVTLLWPGRATAAGLTGVLIALGDVTSMLLAPTEVADPHALFLALLVAGVGGLLCASGTRPQVRIERVSTAVRVGSSVLVVVALAALLVTVTAPAASGDDFPQQDGELGGFVLVQDTLDAGQYNYQAHCPKPTTIDLLDEGCIEATLDSSKKDDVNRFGRQRLDCWNNNEVVIGGFQIYKNFPVRGTDKIESLELSATTAYATGGDCGTFDGDPPEAVDVYASEFRARQLEARLDVVDFPGYDPGIKVDNVNYWECSPQNASGLGSVNDVRFGLDAFPALTNGRDVYLLAHQLGSTKTELTNFELRVRAEKIEDINVTQEPSEAPANCYS